MATIIADSLSLADVTAAVAAATYGDTVILPAGESVEWATGITINKGMTIKGAGVDLTIINCASDYPANDVFRYEPDATSLTNNTLFEIGKMTIDQDNHTGACVQIRNVGDYSPYQYITNVKIHDLKLVNHNNPSSAAQIKIQGKVYGVAWNIQFIDTTNSFSVYGSDQNSWGDCYPSDIACGNANNFFLEDSTVSFTGVWTGDPGMIYSGQGGRIVVRYNSWDCTGVTGGALWDVHGIQSYPGMEQYATITAEYYNNTVTNAACYESMLHRGARLMMFNNTVAATGAIRYAQYGDEELAYYHVNAPNHDVYPQDICQSYQWSNVVNGSTVTSWTKSADYKGDDYEGTPRTENVHFWNHNASFDGSAGIGVGLLSARPATCTTGVGYWATDTNTFYRASATNTWGTYYTPYKYPHPLRYKVLLLGRPA